MSLLTQNNRKLPRRSGIKYSLRNLHGYLPGQVGGIFGIWTVTDATGDFIVELLNG